MGGINIRTYEKFNFLSFQQREQNFYIHLLYKDIYSTNMCI